VDKNINKDKKLYAVAKYPTPVLSTGDFEQVYGGADGKTLKKSPTGLIKELEYVAYEGSVFEVTGTIDRGNHKIYKIYAHDYDIPELGLELFVDSRFVDTTTVKPVERKIVLPSKADIYKYFDANEGALYVWGGNNVGGVSKMFEFYKPAGALDERDELEWGLKGVDCSGLIYEATNGYTPRNTHQLVYFGKPIKIAGLSADEIVYKLQPLDLIVWKGHVIIVYDNKTTIESSHSAWGVIKKDLHTVISKFIKNDRKPMDEWDDAQPKSFVVRRWYAENN